VQYKVQSEQQVIQEFGRATVSVVHKQTSGETEGDDDLDFGISPQIHVTSSFLFPKTGRKIRVYRDERNGAIAPAGSSSFVIL
jgi:hypothetical protein